MSAAVLLDTGPLVAFLNPHDEYHEWAMSVLPNVRSPLLTCEPVLVEACYLLRGLPGAVEGVLELVQRDALQIALHIEDALPSISAMLRKYRDLPMSLADASLVALAELVDDPLVVTLDSHFRLYRFRGRRVIPTLVPTGR